jgi:hypothetical protein
VQVRTFPTNAAAFITSFSICLANRNVNINYRARETVAGHELFITFMKLCEKLFTKIKAPVNTKLKFGLKIPDKSRKNRRTVVVRLGEVGDDSLSNIKASC